MIVFLLKCLKNQNNFKLAKIIERLSTKNTLALKYRSQDQGLGFLLGLASSL